MLQGISPTISSQRAAFRAKPKYAYARDLINSSGLLTKEDLAKVRTIQSRFANISSSEIIEKLAQNNNEINRIFQQFFSNTNMISTMLIYSTIDKITKKLLHKIKSYKLNQFSLSTLNAVNTARTITLYPSNVEYTLSKHNQKQLPVSTKEPLFIHPRDIIQNIIGFQNSDNIKKESAKIYTKQNPQYLIEMQQSILKEFSEYIRKKGNTQNFVYTNADFQQLKSLIVKYDTLCNTLAQHNISVKSIETMLFHPLMPDKINIGDILPNSDIIIDKTKVFDLEEKKKIPVIMTFANTNSGYRLKMYRYDEEIPKLINKIKKQYNLYIKQHRYDKINDLNTYCSKFIKSSEVAELFFQEKSYDEMFEILHNTNLISDDTIKQHLASNIRNKNFVFLRNLKNYNINKYYNVSLPLIKNLKSIILNNDFGDCFINALAYNNVKHSPAGLYLRAGCEPISHSKEEIMTMLRNPDKTFENPILFVCHTAK